LRLKFLN